MRRFTARGGSNRRLFKNNEYTDVQSSNILINYRTKANFG